MSRAAMTQRKRRELIVRIDYTPSPAALALIKARQAREHPGSTAATNSAVISAIVLEWAQVAAADSLPEPLRAKRETPPPARALNVLPRVPATKGLCLKGHDSDRAVDASTGIARRAASLRVVCGAKRHRDGQPCQAKSEPGKRRCRFHGGRSTGPKTPEGKARSAANLPNRRQRRDG